MTNVRHEKGPITVGSEGNGRYLGISGRNFRLDVVTP